MIDDEIKIILSEMSAHPGADQKNIKAAEGNLKVTFPLDYVDFMLLSNGAKAEFVNNYIDIWSIDDVVRAHFDMQMESTMPGFVAFGGDGANEIYAFDMRTETKSVIEVPLIVMTLEDLWFCCNTFTEFLLMKSRGECCK